MRLFDTMLLSIKNLWRRKLRSLLTIMGVMIGTCAIMIMLSLGIAMNRNFMEQVSQMGNIMQIQVYNYNQGGKTPDGKDIPPLDDAMVAKFAKLDGVEGATPIIDIYVKMMVGKYVGSVSIVGMNPEMFEMLDIPVSTGRPLQEGDTNQMVIGKDVIWNFYNPKSFRWEPAPQDLDFFKEKLTISWDMNYGEKYQSGGKSKNPVKPVQVEAVGLIEQMGSEYSWRILMPFETVKKYQKEIEKYNRQNGGSNGGGGIMFASPMYSSSGNNDGYNQVIVKAKNIDVVVDIMNQIKEFGYECYSPVQILESMQEQSAGLRQILLGIGIMSFVIAAIGIANTM